MKHIYRILSTQPLDNIYYKYPNLGGALAVHARSVLPGIRGLHLLNGDLLEVQVRERLRRAAA